MQYNKVEISGVNTSDLIVLKESEKTELLKKARGGDKKAREDLIKGNLRLVLSVLQRFVNRGESADDLFQVGVVGLIKAIDNFDTSLDVKFSTYAVPMIMGELRRFLRDFQPLRVSRSLRDTAKEMGAKRADVVAALESITDPVSLYEPVYSDSGDTLFVLDQVGDCNDDSQWLEELSIKEAIRALQPREKNILYLRFFQGKTQVEVANSIGISQAQVSRLEKGALNKIKEQI